jgi:hypothetical protein
MAKLADHKCHDNNCWVCVAKTLPRMLIGLATLLAAITGLLKLFT